MSFSLGGDRGIKRSEDRTTHGKVRRPNLEETDTDSAPVEGGGDYCWNHGIKNGGRKNY